MGKIIAVAGFKGGVGKSTISNFLAEKIGGQVINLDNYQDAADFNSTETVNLGRSDSIKEAIKNNSSDIYIIDAGGFDDARLGEVALDLLILPTRTDYRSIKTTIDSAVTILERIPGGDALPVLFVINEYERERELETAAEIVQNLLSISEVPSPNLHLFAVKRSGAIRTAIDKKMSLAELEEANRAAYGSVNRQFEELAEEVREILEGVSDG